jgi:AraC-like DNA-binding protein
VDQELPLRHFHEYLVMLIYKTIRTTTRAEFHPTSVSFAHRQEVSIEDYSAFFGTNDVCFEQNRNGITYPNSVLAVPFVTANKLLHSMIVNSLKTYIDDEAKNEFADVVCRELMRLTFQEVPSIELVAANLSVSVRTLRRKLKHEGFTFQTVKQLALERRSKHLLQETNLPLGEISYEVGYSEVSAFCRAFRRWTGHTPQAFRQTHQEQ